MAVCAEENVNTVYTKRLRENIDINEVKCVKCSPDNLYLLVQRLDLTLRLVYIKRGQAYTVCKDVHQFMWSSPAKEASSDRYPTFSVLRHDGSIELFEVKERILASNKRSAEENSKERLVSSVGSLTKTVIKTLLTEKGEEIALKGPRLVNCKQEASNEEDRMDYVTVLFEGYLVVVLSFSVLLSPDVVRGIEMVKHVPAVPFLLPQLAVKDVRTSREMLFILYEHGIILIYDMTNWAFYGWLDVFFKTENTSDAEFSEPQKRPNAQILNVDETVSTVFVCDNTNNVAKINLESYYKRFPNHLHSRRSSEVKIPSIPDEDPPLEEIETTDSESEVEQNHLGDLIWRSEVLAISSEIENANTMDTASEEWLKACQASNIASETSAEESCKVQTSWSTVVRPPPWMEDFAAVGLYCSSESFLLWLEPKRNSDFVEQRDVDHGVLCCYVQWRKAYLVNVFLEKTFVASGGDLTKPICLLTNGMIGLPVFGTTQNELVNQVIMYENVAMAEKLCYLNNWDHFAVPISALEAALKHEQLDTVAFYLKTKGKAFTTIATENEATPSSRPFSPLSPNSFNSKQLYMKPTHSEDVLGQIKGVVNLLLTTVKTSSRRKHSVQFTSQLLQMSFDYVNGLMQDAVSYIERNLGNESDRERIQDILSYLTAQTMELRLFLYGIPPFPNGDGKEELGLSSNERELGEGLSPETQAIIFEKWSDMDDMDVIGDAILSCHIPLAQVYFLNKDELNSTHDGSLRCVMASGMNLVLEALARKDIATATALLKNMGEDVVKLLRGICLKTFDRPLRDYLIEELRSRGELTAEEISSVMFLRSLESTYDNQSFESCQIRRLQHHDCKQFSDLGLLQKAFDPTSPTTKNAPLRTGSISQQYHVALVGRVSAGYCEVILDWILRWDQQTRERVLLEMLVHDEKGFKREFWEMVSETSCWQYLKAHCDVNQIIEWISLTADSSSQDSRLLQPLTFDARSDLSECTSFCREVILDELTRYGLYSKELLTNFPLLLRHLCRTDRLFNKTHPLLDVSCKSERNEEQGAHEAGAVYSMKRFHKEMIEFCSKHKLMNLLYFYLDYYRLAQTREEAEELAPKHEDREVDMVLKFRLAGLYPSEPSVICDMSFSNSCVVLGTSNPSLINMLSNQRPIMAIATCLYAPVDLSQILQPKSGKDLDDMWLLDETILKSTLSCYPRLFSALFPRTASQKLSENPDITLYELLQGNCSFEISSLFAWQSTNTLATRGGLSGDMPHFSQKALVERFAHKEMLTYVYFLKHGRPSFAFIAFLSKYQHRKYVPKTSISKATNKSYQLAVSHFGNNKIVYSCVAFLELLGVDTTFLRIDIGVARRILLHGKKDELQCTTADELKNVIALKLLKCVKDRFYKPKELIATLENATRNLISKEGLDRTSREASHFWSLPIMFCRCHNMTLTPAFLIDCAKADKWLAFICHAQGAQFPKNQVLSIVRHYFETNNLKEHLRQALINVVAVDMKGTKGEKRKRKLAVSKVFRPSTNYKYPNYLSTPVRQAGNEKQIASLNPEFVEHVLVNILDREAYEAVGRIDELPRQMPHEPVVIPIKVAPYYRCASDRIGLLEAEALNPEFVEHVLVNILDREAYEAVGRIDELPCQMPHEPVGILIKFSLTKRDVRSQYLSRVIGVTKSPGSKLEPPSKPQEKNELTSQLTGETEPQDNLEFDEKKELKEDEPEEDLEEDEVDMKNLKEMESDASDLNPETSPDNLFDVLCLCDETREPWRAILAHSIALRRPLLAVLAACYKEANLVDCVCAWLCSIHSKETLHPAITSVEDLLWNHWTLNDLLSLILTVSKCGSKFAHSLTKAFYVFDPNNLMLPLLRFYKAFSIHLDFVAAANQLSGFVMHHKSMSVNEDLQNGMVVGDLLWCEKVANGVVENMLCSCETMYTQVHLLRLLCHSKFGNGFSTQVADFKKLYKISQVLEGGGVFARCIDLAGNETETARILDELLQHHKFTHARDYATLVDIPRDKVSLMQVIQKKKTIQASRLWESERERAAFWKSCDQYLRDQECATAGHFYEEEANSASVSPHEKATLLCLAFNWYAQRENSSQATSRSPADQVQLEIQMWLCIIDDRVRCADEGKSITSVQKFTCCATDSNLVQERNLEIEGNRSCHISNEKVHVLKDIIGELLDEGQITQARRLSVLFGISTIDLDIVLSCIFLAQEIQTAESLDEDIKALLIPKDKPSLSNSLKSSGSFIDRLSQSQTLTEEALSAWTVVGDNLATMENLASSCRFGRICCSRVIVVYKICQTLGLSFGEVVCVNSFELLSSLLGSSFDQRYLLAAQYIKSFNLDSSKIAQFVAKSISSSLNVFTGSKVLEDKVLIVNPGSREDMFNLLSLAEDKLVLGGLLFDEALLLAKQRKATAPSSSALSMEVELLIYAHHCQTLACNTEGISSILKLARFCTHALAKANEYPLMVRLLTGIGRFAEMTYIFQTLMDHHHFELLVRKDVDNENKYKVALLNYLDKHHLEDTEKHLLVAYRFNMHREVAVSMKNSADSQVTKLVKRGLGANNETRVQLVSIAQSYSYAMENFKQEGCLLQALDCAKKHRLVELQKNLLPTGMVILDLTDKTLGEFVAKYNNFFEAYIVADAYNKRSLDTWVEPLFNHVIVGGDFKYFNEICSVFQISNTILSELVTRLSQEIVNKFLRKFVNGMDTCHRQIDRTLAQSRQERRYRSELQRNSSVIANMKKVMRHDKDILSRYKLALELGYREEVDKIKKSDGGAFVRDLRP